MADLTGKRIALVVDDYFEEPEFTGPLDELTAAGAQVDIIATKKGEIRGLNHVDPGNVYQAQFAIDDVSPDDYDALVLPGGAVNADALRMNNTMRDWARQFVDESKPVAAICHAPWLLASAGVAKGKRLTSYMTIQDDMRNAGADWTDEEVVVDGSLITSRKPDDVPAFNRELINMLST